MSDAPNEPSGLGSLAQSARGKHLKQARGILIAIGILMVLGQTAMYFVETAQVKGEIQKEIRAAGPDVVIDQADVREAEETVRRALLLVHGGAIALGVVFVILGIFVERSPVALTALGLVLYLGKEAVF